MMYISISDCVFNVLIKPLWLNSCLIHLVFIGDCLSKTKTNEDTQTEKLGSVFQCSKCLLSNVSERLAKIVLH